ncbi:PREDICTED: 60S ribosomal protein L36a-like [Miniopterus natalensis]|uniref:60S ribosomal protein L36a-like n=1 Tax=Miniopterus natalensis TaxID=291302 RepID=UPI0007A6C3B7|nr:PREDICTED: 60S ribosomal protein L36a-like [Miniopterus natalensis]
MAEVLFATLGHALAQIKYSRSLCDGYSALANRVNGPKTCPTFCKCGEHQPHRVTQCKKGKRHHGRKQSGYGGQTEPIFHKKTKTTKKIMLGLGCVEPNCRSQRLLAINRCKHFEPGGDKKRKGQVIQF